MANERESCGYYQKVTVFSDRALIEQEATVAVPSGTTVLS